MSADFLTVKIHGDKAHVGFRLVVDRQRMDAHKQAIAAERLIGAKKWIRAEKIIQCALEECSGSVPANITAGKLYMRTKQINKAKKHLDQALRLNPRANIQKELGWVNLEMGEFSIALSLLNDHLHRNPLDTEAQNLLLQCYYETGRYELGADLARQNLSDADCFLNNYFLCRVMSGEKSKEIFEEKDMRNIDNAFLRYNLAVIDEDPKSWDEKGNVSLRSKLLFQDFRFGKKKSRSRINAVSIEVPGKEQQDYSQMIITIGRNPANMISSPDHSVSRRHCVIVNYPDDVWIYDLASACGTFINGERICGKMFLLGVCELTVGRYGLRVTSAAGMLV
jgi:tetratricopeptide (TPR) repeat protein